MKGIVRKRLVALLSLAGFAGSAAPAPAQVLKGADQAPDSKTESKIKSDKNKREKNATTDVVNKKLRKTGQNNGGLSADDKRKKGSLSAEADTVKVSKNNKEQKLSMEHKNVKVSSEHKSAKTEALTKDSRATAGANAAQGEAAQKANQTTPK